MLGCSQILMTNSLMVHDACFGVLSFYKMFALVTSVSSKCKIAVATTFFLWLLE